MQYALTVLGTLMSSLLFTPIAQAQVATIESVQTFPLAIAAPFNTFTSPQPTVVTLQVSEPAALTVTAPTPNGFSDPNGTQYSSFVRYGDSQSSNGTPLSINTTGSIDVEIGMQVNRQETYSVGTYNYNVLLTITAQ